MDDEFEKACINNNMKKLKYLISYYKIYIHENKDSMFELLCKYGYFDIMKYMIEYYKGTHNEINIHNRSAFYLACIGGHLGIVKYMLNNDNINKLYYTDSSYMHFLLINVCKNGYLHVLKYIIEYYKIDLNSDNNFLMKHNLCRSVCENGHVHIIKYFIQLLNIFHETDMFTISCESGSFEAAIYLIKHFKLNIHINNEFALINAYKFENIRFMKFLIKYGERNNNKCDIKLLHLQTFSSLYYNCIREYLSYLIKHNYGPYNKDKIITKQHFKGYGNKYFYNNMIVDINLLYKYSDNINIFRTDYWFYIRSTFVFYTLHNHCWIAHPRED